MTDKIWGASQEDWFNFSVIHGIEEDLLPVVSNSTKEISKNSGIKAIGKVPSVYNKGGYVVGFPKWAQHISTAEQIAKWGSNPDIGISISCKNVRGIDVDVDDGILSAKILKEIEAFFGKKFPIRWRTDSSRFLIMVKVAGIVPYSCIKVDEEKAGDAIEFLGNGRQFIAVGTHTKGQRYIVDWEDCNTFPEISIEKFDELIKHLHVKFGVGDLVGKTHTERKQLSRIAMQDETVEKLDILGEGKDGQLYIECPFVE
ncbi:bifunctional DNA primase/polymerase, partial [Candidatus Pacearchaeota archaeon]|nr:bifunctional DNA primase/polymerase [Candidatus Pacearchaeota archaeon]